MGNNEVNSDIYSNPEEDDNDTDESDVEIEIPQRKRRKWIFIVGGILLVLLVIVTIISPLRAIVFRPFTGSNAQPAATLIPGDNLYYIQEALPGTVTIDGRRVTHLLSNIVQPPIDPTLYAPFQLSRGVHRIIWQSAPFNPLSCTVFVPSLANTQSCPYQSPISLDSGVNAWLIAFTPALSNLPLSQEAVLKNSIQTTLNTLHSSAMVQPGERYLQNSAVGYAAPVAVTQPLTATLSLHLDTDPNSPRSCVNGYGDTCNVNGQNCLQICTFSYRDGAWLAVALYYVSWTYSTESGQVIARDQADTASNLVGGDHSVLLAVTWTRRGWQVKDLSALSQTAQNLIGVLDTPIPACASLTEMISTQTSYGSTRGDDHLLIQWSYYIGSDPAEGCLGVVVPSNSPQSLPAYFLYRFGVLLAANNLAHQYFPSLPVADAYEQRIAQNIAAQNKP